MTNHETNELTVSTVGVVMLNARLIQLDSTMEYSSLLIERYFKLIAQLK